MPGLGYHCVYFDLAIIERCPWHGEILTPPCIECMRMLKRCKRPLQSALRPVTVPSEGHTCGQRPLIEQVLAPATCPSRAQARSIRHACLTLLRWQRRLARTGRRRAPWEFDVFRLVGEQASSQASTASHRKAVEQALRDVGPCPWPLSVVDGT